MKMTRFNRCAIFLTLGWLVTGGGLVWGKLTARVTLSWGMLLAIAAAPLVVLVVLLGLLGWLLADADIG